MTAPLILPAEAMRARHVRVLEPGDLGAVALLFHKTFRGSAAPAPESLRSYLGEVFLGHPWRDPDMTSRVHISAEGRVDGFIGVLPLHMILNGTKLRAAVAGALMVDEPQKNPLAGARLLRAFFAGPQELSISETANPLSQGMWTRLGGRVLPLLSMEWLRVLKPAGAAASLLSHALPAAKILRPLAWAADGALSRMRRNPFRFQPPSPPAFTRDEEAGEDTFIAYALRYASQFSLRPDWNEDVLRWLLSHTERKESYGKLTRRLVYGNGTDPIGGYIAYMRPGGMAWVLQVLAEPGRVEPILDSLMAHAQSHGAVALRGRTHPMLMEPLLKRGCFFLHRSSTLVHARDANLLAALPGDALITGLAGETWSRLIGGIFR